MLLQLLVSQALVAVQQVDDAAIAESVAGKDMLQDVVVAVGIGPQVGYLPVTPFQAGGGYPVAVFSACQAMDNSVGLGVVQPGSFVNMCIGRVFAGNEGKGANDVSLLVQADVAVAVCHVFLDKLGGGVSARPLFQVPAFPHDAFPLFKNIHQDVQVGWLAFSDGNHKCLSLWLVQR